MAQYLEYIGALSPRKGVGPALIYPGYKTKQAPGAFNRGQDSLGEGVLGALSGGGGGGGGDDEDVVDDDDVVVVDDEDVVDDDDDVVVVDDPPPVVDDPPPTDTDPGVLITPTKKPPNDGNQITWLDELPKTGQNIAIKMLEMNPDADVSKDRILAEFYYDGQANSRRISEFYRNYYNWRRDKAIEKSKNKSDSSSTVSTNLTEQPDGTVRPGADQPKITDTSNTSTTSSTSDTSSNTNSGSNPVINAGSTTQQPSGKPGVLNPSSTSDSEDDKKSDGELSEEVQEVLRDLGVLDAAGVWTKPDITVDIGANGEPQILINGKTVDKTVIDAIKNQFPDIIRNSPAAKHLPSGDTHLKMGGEGGILDTGVGVAVPVDTSKEGISGDPVIYKDVSAGDVEDFRRNPLWWLRSRATQAGRSARDIWNDVKDRLGLSDEEKEALEASDQIDGTQITGGYAGYTSTDPTSVTGGDSFSGGWYENPLGTGEPDFYTPERGTRYGRATSPLADFGIKEGRGLPYSKFPVDGGQSSVYGEVLIDKMQPHGNTLTSEVDRMVAESLPFVSVTGPDGTPMMYDKQTGQTLSLPEYGALVKSRNTIGLPPGVNQIPGRLPSYRGYG